MVLIGPSPSGTKAANTANMITAAATTTRDDVTNPSVMRALGVDPCVTYASRIRETRKTS